MKNKTDLSQVCKRMKCDFFCEFATVIKKIEFDEVPNYGLLKHLLVRNLLDKEMVPNCIFDWNKRLYSESRSSSYNNRLKALNLDIDFLRGVMNRKNQRE